MRCVRNSQGQVLVLAEDGRVLAELVGLDATGDEFDALAEALPDLLQPPRVLVTYRDGLLGEVQADIPCDVIVIEEDRHDVPPVAIRRRPVPAGDRSAVDAALTGAEARAS